ncbi:hypothetical protein FXO38_36258, partial [Capsicum annuum]
LYYQYIPEGKEFPILCKKLDAESKGWMKTVSSYMISVSKEEQVLLDWNGIAERHVSPNHNYLVYTIDVTGSKQVVLQIKDLRNDCVLPALRVEGVFSVYVINATNLQTGIQRFCKHVSSVQYFLEHHHGFFYVLTNSCNGGEESSPWSGEYYLARCPAET